MNKREAMQEKRRHDMNRTRTITFSVIILGALLIGGIIAYPYLKPSGAVFSRPDAKDNATGKSDAPVRVEEFSDYQCPYCRLFWQNSEQKLVETYVAKGQVQFIFTPYSFLGEESKSAAEAAYCAMDQGKFWDYHDQLFGHQAGENQGAFANAMLLTFGRNIKLEMNSFQECIKTKKYQQIVEDNVKYGVSKGVTGTPMFVVNERLVDASQVIQAIELALQSTP